MKSLVYIAFEKETITSNKRMECTNWTDVPFDPNNLATVGNSAKQGSLNSSAGEAGGDPSKEKK